MHAWWQKPFLRSSFGQCVCACVRFGMLIHVWCVRDWTSARAPMVSVSLSDLVSKICLYICVDMSLPMHFNKFMVAIKRIVTVFALFQYTHSELALCLLIHAHTLSAYRCVIMCFLLPAQMICCVAYARWWFIFYDDTILLLILCFIHFMVYIMLFYSAIFCVTNVFALRERNKNDIQML